MTVICLLAFAEEQQELAAFCQVLCSQQVLIAVAFAVFLYSFFSPGWKAIFIACSNLRLFQKKKSFFEKIS
jgi:hypothetical protein